jgi:hypothetical protein
VVSKREPGDGAPVADSTLRSSARPHPRLDLNEASSERLEEKTPVEELQHTQLVGAKR